MKPDFSDKTKYETTRQYLLRKQAEAEQKKRERAVFYGLLILLFAVFIALLR